MKNKVKRLEVFTLALLVCNLILLTIILFMDNQSTKFEEIDVERINIVEADGTLKLAIFNSNRLKRGLDGDKRAGSGSISGMLFYNQEGYETGGLLFDGKKVSGGQDSGIGLMFDGYRQDQTIALQHNELKDSLKSYYEDGLKISSRPDRMDVKEEYAFYALKYPDKFGDGNTPKLDQTQLDSLEYLLSRQNKIAQRRLFLGSIRGDQGEGWFDESGLYIKNKYGKDMIRIYVNEKNEAKFEVLDTLGNTIQHNLIP